ncbi:hypothetical protein ACFQ48_15695 [Hymenobacter caeli]|uniref:Uncharacterized protein n=1 Tax=Hymenobacter caeli TaxID=2735894 RepID=A0ABX2FU42_9BACT|nr:hypothetical protein [Hymenobacter caeli]NRT20531.1 hypothetical protein [Hymenobacter caeli]
MNAPNITVCVIIRAINDDKFFVESSGSSLVGKANEQQQQANQQAAFAAW